MKILLIFFISILITCRSDVLPSQLEPSANQGLSNGLNREAFFDRRDEIREQNIARSGRSDRLPNIARAGLGQSVNVARKGSLDEADHIYSAGGPSYGDNAGTLGKTNSMPSARNNLDPRSNPYTQKVLKNPLPYISKIKTGVVGKLEKGVRVWEQENIARSNDFDRSGRAGDFHYVNYNDRRLGVSSGPNFARTNEIYRRIPDDRRDGYGSNVNRVDDVYRQDNVPGKLEIARSGRNGEATPIAEPIGKSNVERHGYLHPDPETEYNPRHTYIPTVEAIPDVTLTEDNSNSGRSVNSGSNTAVEDFEYNVLAPDFENYNEKTNPLNNNVAVPTYATYPTYPTYTESDIDIDIDNDTYTDQSEISNRIFGSIMNIIEDGEDQHSRHEVFSNSGEVFVTSGGGGGGGFCGGGGGGGGCCGGGGGGCCGGGGGCCGGGGGCCCCGCCCGGCCGGGCCGGGGCNCANNNNYNNHVTKTITSNNNCQNCKVKETTSNTCEICKQQTNSNIINNNNNCNCKVTTTINENGCSKCNAIKNNQESNVNVCKTCKINTNTNTNTNTNIVKTNTCQKCNQNNNEHRIITNNCKLCNVKTQDTCNCHKGNINSCKCTKTTNNVVNTNSNNCNCNVNSNTNHNSNTNFNSNTNSNYNTNCCINNQQSNQQTKSTQVKKTCNICNEFNFESEDYTHGGSTSQSFSSSGSSSSSMNGGGHFQAMVHGGAWGNIFGGAGGMITGRGNSGNDIMTGSSASSSGTLGVFTDGGNLEDTTIKGTVTTLKSASKGGSSSASSHSSSVYGGTGYGGTTLLSKGIFGNSGAFGGRVVGGHSAIFG